jgi:hypothetical protein
MPAHHPWKNRNLKNYCVPFKGHMPFYRLEHRENGGNITEKSSENQKQSQEMVTHVYLL